MCPHDLQSKELPPPSCRISWLNSECENFLNFFSDHINTARTQAFTSYLIFPLDMQGNQQESTFSPHDILPSQAFDIADSDILRIINNCLATT